MGEEACQSCWVAGLEVAGGIGQEAETGAHGCGGGGEVMTATIERRGRVIK